MVIPGPKYQCKVFLYCNLGLVVCFLTHNSVMLLMNQVHLAIMLVMLEQFCVNRIYLSKIYRNNLENVVNSDCKKNSYRNTYCEEEGMTEVSFMHDFLRQIFDPDSVHTDYRSFSLPRYNGLVASTNLH